MRKSLFILIGVLLNFHLIAQSELERLLDFSVENMPVADALINLCEKADVGISFQSRLLAEAPNVNIQYKKKSLKFLLTACLKDTEIGFKWEQDRIVLF